MKDNLNCEVLRKITCFSLGWHLLHDWWCMMLLAELVFSLSLPVWVSCILDWIKSDCPWDPFWIIFVLFCVINLKCEKFWTH